MAEGEQGDVGARNGDAKSPRRTVKVVRWLSIYEPLPYRRDSTGVARGRGMNGNSPRGESFNSYVTPAVRATMQPL